MSHDNAHPDQAAQGYDWSDPHHFHHGDDAQADHDHDGHHVTPWQILFGILLVLLFLTFLTVVSAQAETWLISLGVHISHFWNVVIAMSIALVKATLVCMYFMHLKHDNPLNTMILLTTLFVFMLFILFTGIDIYERDAINTFKAGEINQGGTGVGVTLTGGNFGDNITDAVKQRHIDKYTAEHAKKKGHLDENGDPVPTEDDIAYGEHKFWTKYYDKKLDAHPEHAPTRHGYDTNDHYADWLAHHIESHGDHHISTASESVLRHGLTPGLFDLEAHHVGSHEGDHGGEHHDDDHHADDHPGEEADQHAEGDHDADHPEDEDH